MYSNDALTNVDGFSGVTSIGSYLNIQDNAALTNVDGFSGVTTIATYLKIQDNTALTNVDGFNGLTSIGSYLTIQNNDALENINGFNGLLVINTDISIIDNIILDECCLLNEFFNGSRYLGGAALVSGNNNNCVSIPVIIISCKVSQQDIDNDGVINTNDNCQDTSNPNQEDTDSDGIGDVCDNCPDDANPAQADANNNGIGDICEASGSGTDAGGVGIGTTDPKSQLEITQGDVFIKNNRRGIIMKSPNGKCFRYQPNEEGNLKAKEITCPDN
ncbi:MAG TPA: hypothetical protein EYG85_06020 [Crocinitomix sp.]|nr:hypothetical protein [Crocinitomix sp.]